MAEKTNISKIFGENVFNDTVMQERLPKNMENLGCIRASSNPFRNSISPQLKPARKMASLK